MKKQISLVITLLLFLAVSACSVGAPDAPPKKFPADQFLSRANSRHSHPPPRSRFRLWFRWASRLSRSSSYAW
jgi:hypothetical protein